VVNGYRCLFGAGVLMAVVVHAGAWTTPIAISGIKSTNARIARGAGGALHVAWYSDWRVQYRFRNGAGQWGPVEQLSNFFSHRLDVIEDAQGRPHVVYVGNGAGGKADLYHAIKTGGTWQQTNITNSDVYDEDEPRMARDAQGRLRMVYTKSQGGNTIIYRVWDGSSWSAEAAISSGGDSYYHRPDIAIDPSGNLHVVHASGNELYYLRHNGSSWTSRTTIASDWGEGAFYAYPKVAVAGSGQVVVVVYQVRTGGLHYQISNNGGAGWGPSQWLESGHWPNLDGGPDGQVHAAFTWLNVGGIGYRRWTGSAWTPTESVGPHPNWQGWADVTADTNNVVHVVFDDSKPEGTVISFVSNTPDTTPPGPVTNFTAVPGHGVVGLSWTNPTDLDFMGTMVRFSTSGPPATIHDGFLLVNKLGNPGAHQTQAHSGLTNGVRYYYTAFSYDQGMLYGPGVQVSATPYVPPDMDRDGDVDQLDFGRFQRCLTGPFVLQEDPACLDARLDADDDVDGDDANLFVRCLSGAGVPYNPNCLP